MDLFGAMAMFVRVVDSGSLSAAARSAGISSTMAGKHLRALEQHLGMRLLHRTTRQQHLTEFGRLYYDRCQEVQALIADIDALAMATQAVPRGRLRITAPASFGAQRLVPRLHEYLKQYPAVDLDLELNDRVADLVEEGFEVAIRIGPLPSSGMIGRPLARYRMVICAAPEYLSRCGTPLTPDDLTHHNCLAFSSTRREDGMSASTEWPLAGPNGLIAVAVVGRMRIDNTQALRRAALQGMGIVMLPLVLLEDDIAAGRLVRLMNDYEPPSREMHVVYAPDRRMSLKLRTFVDFVVEQFGQ